MIYIRNIKNKKDLIFLNENGKYIVNIQVDEEGLEKLLKLSNN